MLAFGFGRFSEVCDCCFVLIERLSGEEEMWGLEGLDPQDFEQGGRFSVH